MVYVLLWEYVCGGFSMERKIRVRKKAKSKKKAYSANNETKFLWKILMAVLSGSINSNLLIKQMKILDGSDKNISAKVKKEKIRSHDMKGLMALMDKNVLVWDGKNKKFILGDGLFEFMIENKEIDSGIIDIAQACRLCGSKA